MNLPARFLSRLCGLCFLLSPSSTLAQAEAEPSPIEQKLDVIIEKLDKAVISTTAPAATAAPTPAPSTAPDTTAIETLQVNINFVWILIAAILVFNMQAGFALVELGLSRAKNSINIVMKNFLDFCISTVAFLLIGFALMFGKSWNGWIGTDGFWLSDLPADSSLWAFWFFQVVFAGTACTIVSGAMAERTKFMGYLVYAGFLGGIIYPICGHWAWGSFAGGFGWGGEKGWLEAMGFIDFAGSTVVHGVGGACALAGILVVGSREGRFAKDGTPILIAGHNIPLAALGTFLLWFGWFGFNAGSTLAANAGIGRIAVNTAVAPAAGALAAMFSMWFVQRRPDVCITLNGALGGLVGITACCANVTPGSALIIGVVAGLLTTFSTIMLERMRLDDAVGAVPVHLVNGWWGTLSVALFHEKGFDAGLLGTQLLGTAVITGSAFAAAFAVFKSVDLLVGLRATNTEQEDGLDFSEHSANAYPDFHTSEQGA